MTHPGPRPGLSSAALAVNLALYVALWMVAGALLGLGMGAVKILWPV